MKQYYDDNVQEFGCAYCWDKRKEKSIEIFFLDKANNMRLCQFCPNCGRILIQETENE